MLDLRRGRGCSAVSEPLREEEPKGAGLSLIPSLA